MRSSAIKGGGGSILRRRPSRISDNARNDAHRLSWWRQVLKPYLINYDLYLMLIPVLIWYFLFRYLPIYGVQIAFKDFLPFKGIWDSPWVGFKHFVRFFQSYYFWRLIRNTVGISIYTLAVEFPAAIILALLLNEVRNPSFKRVVQNVTYVPHFLSVVVIVGMLSTFSNARYGIFNQIITLFGGEPTYLLARKELFKTLYVFTNTWQNTGWRAIIYMAALAGINPNLYEAAVVDGASRFRQIIHISLPGILPTIIILLILRIGRILTLEFHKILLMQNPLNMATSDVISTFVYRVGILEGNYSFSTAVGLFNAVLNLLLLLLANRFAKRMSETSLW
jgi:putative aldouronate transport system permease protein